MNRYIYVYIIWQKWNYANVSSLSIPNDEILSVNENWAVAEMDAGSQQ